MPWGAGPFPPSRDECFECVPVTDDFGAEFLFGMGRAGKEQPVLMTPAGQESELKEPFVEQTVLEEGPRQMMQELVNGAEAAWTGSGVEPDVYEELSLAADATGAVVAVSKEEEEDGNEQDGLLDAVNDIATGIFAALAAAAAAVFASVASDALTEISDVLFPSSISGGDGAFTTSEGHLDPPPEGRESEPRVQTVHDATRLRGAGAKVLGDGWPGSVALDGETTDHGMTFGDTNVAKTSRRKLQVSSRYPLVFKASQELSVSPDSVVTLSDLSFVLEEWWNASYDFQT